jgi:catechol 2,3-dioxygenase-like lactoylglutathione lyase family enzyme
MTPARRTLLHSLIVIVLMFLAVHPAHASLDALQVGCPNISVASLEHSVSFYTTVLDFKLKGEEDSSAISRLVPSMPSETRSRSAHLMLGEECIDLTEYSSPRGAAFPDDSHGNDCWFQHVAIVVSDMDQAYARLRAAKVRFVSNVPQRLPAWNKEAADISALYFRDPDGHYLELIHFPPGKGQPKWQISSGDLFLGIDHTAIVVTDMARSLAFYRDKLHFRVVGGSDNYGTEQEHLSGVFDAHVLITSLRADSGIGIELLDYLTPTSGRSIPANFRPDDISCWQVPIDVKVLNSEREEKHLRWITLPLTHPGDGEEAWITDPDGHLLELVKR